MKQWYKSVNHILKKLQNIKSFTIDTLKDNEEFIMKLELSINLFLFITLSYNGKFITAELKTSNDKDTVPFPISDIINYTLKKQEKYNNENNTENSSNKTTLINGELFSYQLP